jgi:hypothetical protein
MDIFTTFTKPTLESSPSPPLCPSCRDMAGAQRVRPIPTPPQAPDRWGPRGPLHTERHRRAPS